MTQSYLLRSSFHFSVGCTTASFHFKKIMIVPDLPPLVPTRTEPTTSTALTAFPPAPPAYKLATRHNQQSLGTPVLTTNNAPSKHSYPSHSTATSSTAVSIATTNVSNSHSSDCCPPSLLLNKHCSQNMPVVSAAVASMQDYCTSIH
jgi:hypothetical protein